MFLRTLRTTGAGATSVKCLPLEATLQLVRVELADSMTTVAVETICWDMWSVPTRFFMKRT